MFGIILKDLREEKQITQSQLGEFLHLNQRTISNYENGIRFPSEDILISIADYFEVSLDYLFGRTKIKNIYNDKNDTY
jgi:transcriptional regulator with XRE-family HTH domain